MLWGCLRDKTVEFVHFWCVSNNAPKTTIGFAHFTQSFGIHRFLDEVVNWVVLKGAKERLGALLVLRRAFPRYCQITAAKVDLPDSSRDLWRH